jgi:ubiquinone/menaquinone biosynthesis C-methylase UbiE
MAEGHAGIYKLVARLLMLGPSDYYLEIGCGSGMFIKRHAADARHVTGIDYSEDMVALSARINADRVKAGTATFVPGEVSALPWTEETFDAVASIETFFFWPDPPRDLKNIYRVIRPGGRIVISMGWTKDDGLDHTDNIEKYGIKIYSEFGMRQLLIDNDFSKPSFKYLHKQRSPKIMVVSARKEDR